MPVFVLAPLISVDADAVDGAAIRPEAAISAGTTRLMPTTDVIPAELISTYLTEAGPLQAPFGAALNQALATAP